MNHVLDQAFRVMVIIACLAIWIGAYTAIFITIADRTGD